MSKVIFGLAAIALLMVITVQLKAVGSAHLESEKSVYNFKVKDIDGKDVELKEYKGKVMVVVNVASKCGYTPQYTDLQTIYKEFKEKGVEVLGFPANNYGGQEPGTEADIKEFCTTNFNVTFPMFSKVSVKGEDQHELFKYLTSLKNPDFDGEIKWNFEKFIIGKDGKLLRRFRSKTKPTDEEFKAALEEALK